MIDDVLVLTTGGTIDKVYFDANSHYSVGAPVVGAVLKAMNSDIRITLEEVCRKDSLDIDDQDRRLLRERILASTLRHVLITHGTDSMVKTALSLGTIEDKVIVFTGAIQPAAFRDTDGIFNIGTAMGVLSTAAPGVYIAMNGQAFLANAVFKNYQTQRFEAC